MKNFKRITLTAVLAASALLATGCGANNAQPVSNPASASALAPQANIIAKATANEGKGSYLQTTIADTDPAMKYNSSIADDAAKAHYSDTDLAEAQKVVVKFIAEEAIDSTLNGGGNNVDAWWTAHKDQIHPANQAPMLSDLKAGKGILATESWMANKTDYSYVHGDKTYRVIERNIVPVKLRYLKKDQLDGVMLDTKVSYKMAVTDGTHIGAQATTGEVSFSVAKDPSDGGKWKIAGYTTAYHTTPINSFTGKQ